MTFKTLSELSEGEKFETNGGNHFEYLHRVNLRDGGQAVKTRSLNGKYEGQLIKFYCNMLVKVF